MTSGTETFPSSSSLSKERAVSIKHPDLESLERSTAIIKIQRAWRRHHNVNAQHGGPSDGGDHGEPGATADDRWNEVALHTRLKTQNTDAIAGNDEVRKRWRRAVLLANRLRHVDEHASGSASATTSHDELDKILETQHWLELTDSKHRYGSNLKFYHRKWVESDTTDNFFRWLDHGGGKDLSLPECTREELESERIIYLSSEQRKNYLVGIDERGLLRWVRNNELVDTTAGKWIDARDGSGIIPYDIDRVKTTATARRRTSFEEGSNLPVSERSIVEPGSEQSHKAMHYLDTSMESNWFKRWFTRHFTAKGLTDRLLRKTVKRNTWIYVADKHFNIYIGIKETGAFQHSSFLSGGLVASAGLISVHRGLIHTLSPLSGHYRTSIDHFRKFIDVLKEKGVDMHSARISKAEVALWGIEHFNRFKKAKGRKKRQYQGHLSKSLCHAKELAEEKLRRSDTKYEHWKNEILLGRKMGRQAAREEPSSS